MTELEIALLMLFSNSIGHSVVDVVVNHDTILLPYVFKVVFLLSRIIVSRKIRR